MTAWNLFSYETIAPITVTKLMLIWACSKWAWPKFSAHYARNYKLQPHYNKIPRSAPALGFSFQQPRVLGYAFGRSCVLTALGYHIFDPWFGP